MLEIYLTGIKPNSGITLIAGGIAAAMQGLGYSTALYVPVQMNTKVKNGIIQAPDLIFTKYMDKNITTSCSYLYKSKKLTSEVCEKENLYIDKNIIFKDYIDTVNKHECVIVTGQSDMQTYFEPNFNEEDLLKTISIPIVLAASLRNSNVSEILDYLNFMRIKQMNIRGIILNECPPEHLTSKIKQIQRTIEERTEYPVLGIIPTIQNFNKLKPEDWLEYIICRTDIEAIFNVKIAKISA